MINKVHSLRLKNGLTQSELAELSGVSRTSLSLIETGATEPKLETLKKIASALQVKVQDIIEE